MIDKFFVVFLAVVFFLVEGFRVAVAAFFASGFFAVAFLAGAFLAAGLRARLTGPSAFTASVTTTSPISAWALLIGLFGLFSAASFLELIVCRKEPQTCVS